ncbi:MAG TPA: S8 family serine peptidase [Patescibacteria group bacterium]|nr:S8 family serine peptidase [Patescibacteria group bacterium]
MCIKILLITFFFTANVLFAQNSIIVKLRPNAPPAALLKTAQPVFKNQINTFEKKNAILSTMQHTVLKELEKYYTINFKKGENPQEILTDLLKNSDVEFAEINRIYKIEGAPNDVHYGEQWALKKIGAEAAWAHATGKGVKVGIVDTGIDFLHRDLLKNLWVNSTEDINKNRRFDPWPATQTVEGVTGDIDGIDNDENGFTDDIIGYDFVDQTVDNLGDALYRDGIPYDEQGHGTSVAGVIAAERNNRIGIAGLAFESQLVTLRAFDATGNGEEDDIAAAIVYAALNGVQVLNLSFGDVVKSPIMRDAIRFANSMNCVVISSAGNNGGSRAHFPSDFDEVMSIAATTHDDFRTIFSAFGSHISMSAPGEGILTTAVGGGYRSVGGTSFSAPYVAATAALLLEKNPRLKPAEVRGILQASADEAGTPGWDVYYGSGRLNAARALEARGATKVEVYSPQNDNAFKKVNTERIPIIADVATPFFKRYRIDYGAGENPSVWILLDSASQQRIGDTLSFLETRLLKDTTYTIRLKIETVYGAEIERRVRFEIVSDSLYFTFLKAEHPFFNQRRELVISARTNRKSRLFADVHAIIDTLSDYSVSNVYRFTKNHTLLIPEIPGGFSSEVSVIAISEDGDTARVRIDALTNKEGISVSGFKRQAYSLPASYLNNAVGDLYGDGKDYFVINDISSGTWGAIKTVYFENGVFKTRDSLFKAYIPKINLRSWSEKVGIDSVNLVWIPRSIGDSNGDGILEIFAQVSGKSVLFQAKKQGENPFKNIIFQDTTDNNFWASRLADLDGDGRDELIARTDSGYIAMTFRNGKYEFLAAAKNPSMPAPGSNRNNYGPPLSAVADFDGDGKMELAYSDEDGDLLIYEFAGGRFTQEAVFETMAATGGGSEFVTAADVDGDGRAELLFGAPAPQSYDDNPDREYATPLWTFHLLKSSSVNAYRRVWSDHIYGVRYGGGFRNGVSAGNIDTRAGDEIIIAAFPNLYAFTWDTARETLKPSWTTYPAYTNTAIIHDFNKNGVAEIGFVTDFTTEFFEYNGSARLPAPTSLKGFAVNSTTAALRWNASPGAEKYRVIMIRNPLPGQNSATPFETENTFLTVPNLDPLQRYYFVVMAIRDTDTSDESNSVIVIPHDAVTLQTIEVKDERNLFLKFNGFVPETPVEPRAFSVFKNGELISYASTVHNAGDNALLITLLKPLEFSGEYRLVGASFEDFFGTPVNSFERKFMFLKDTADFEELYLLKIAVISSTLLKLDFSNDVKEADVLDIANYELLPNGTIARIERESASSVRIHLAEPLGALGKSYTLTARNIHAQSGGIMTRGAGNTLGFVFAENTAENAFVYPAPVILSRDQTITFAGLPRQADVIVTTIEGEIITILKESDGNGGVEWDGTTRTGKRIGSGVYLFKVRLGGDQDLVLKKFIVVE